MKITNVEMQRRRLCAEAKGRLTDEMSRFSEEAEAKGRLTDEMSRFSEECECLTWVEWTLILHEMSQRLLHFGLAEQWGERKDEEGKTDG